jgi:phage tail-like protein
VPAQGEVVLVDAASEPLRRWQFVDAFPVRWTGPSFVAGSADVAVEELEIGPPWVPVLGLRAAGP